ncbi:MAG: hypothetical protein GAK28_00591 [Luteibacter sp.]|uniref:hypothetical protein n=1 Tax=Luteibacter sp. TaxID=1886636 RepID=UPI00137D0A01|nr:hypothetical protein [Luteibacter sp.]KAF1008959.1 MAG: hypothetical protein GAK28_00591 [Luteibacter sp.]
MTSHTLRQRAALRYASIKHDGDHEVRAEAEASPPSSTPTLQRFFESAKGLTILLTIGLAILALAASGRLP